MNQSKPIKHITHISTIGHSEFISTPNAFKLKNNPPNTSNKGNSKMANKIMIIHFKHMSNGFSNHQAKLNTSEAHI